MKQIWRLRAGVGYRVARRMFRHAWCVRQPRLWQWMQGQYARMAVLGDTEAQSFYGHLLLFRGQGVGAREEGIRLLKTAAMQGDAKAAYQLGMQSQQEQPSDMGGVIHWWSMAAEAGHPLAARRLAELYCDGAEGVAADPGKAEHFTRLAQSRHWL